MNEKDLKFSVQIRISLIEKIDYTDISSYYNKLNERTKVIVDNEDKISEYLRRKAVLLREKADRIDVSKEWTMEIVIKFITYC